MKITRSLIAALLLAASTLAPAKAQQDLIFGPGPGAAQDQQRPGTALDTIVAVVEEDIITRHELEQAMAGARAQIRQRGATPPDESTLAAQVLERLILTRLQEQVAERSGITVDDQTLNAAMESIARRNDLTLTQLRQVLARDGVPFDEFRERIRGEIATARLRQRVVEARLQVTEQEVNNFLASAPEFLTEYRLAQILVALPEEASGAQIARAEERVLGVLEQLRQGADFQNLARRVSDGREALEGGELGWRTQAQIPALFRPLLRGLGPGQVSEPVRSPLGVHIIKVLDVRGGAAASAQGAAVEQTRARHILIETGNGVTDDQARERLERLLIRIRQGEDFAELARANSTDAGSAGAGGDLGWVVPGQTAPAFERAMNELAPGEVSEPFQSPFGWHIVQVLERRREAPGDTAARAAAREALLEQKAEEEWDLWLRRLRDDAFVEIRLPESG